MKALFKCKDGATVSVIAGVGCYSTPRGSGPWSAVEAGFPTSDIPDSWKKYAEDADYSNTVFGWMPVPLLQDYFDLHGGLRPAGRLEWVALKRGYDELNPVPFDADEYRRQAGLEEED